MKRYLLHSTEKPTVIRGRGPDGHVKKSVRHPWVTVRLVTEHRRLTLSGFAGTPVDLSPLALEIHADAIAEAVAAGQLKEEP